MCLAQCWIMGEAQGLPLMIAFGFLNSHWILLNFYFFKVAYRKYLKGSGFIRILEVNPFN